VSAFREFARIKKMKPKKLEAWLAKDGGTDVRHALYELLQEGSGELLRLEQAAPVAMKAAGLWPRPAQGAAPSAATPPQPESTPQPIRKKQGMVWKCYLNSEELRKVDALRPAHNTFMCWQKKPAVRDAWLAADDKQRSRHALYNKLHNDHND
jgi:hypothetical protein